MAPIWQYQLLTEIHSDRLYFFDNGRVVETGTYQELSMQSEHFKALMKAGEPKNETKTE